MTLPLVQRCSLALALLPHVSDDDNDIVSYLAIYLCSQLHRQRGLLRLL